jgi:Amt family ammonium transporter
MSDTPLLTFGLAFLLPIGYALIGASGLPRDRARSGAVALLAALGLAIVGYVITGFALQYGGIGLTHDAAGYDGLIWEWSALGVTWGPGWGMAGLAGWGLSGPAETPAARELALGNLPAALLASLIPVLALRGRIPGWATALLGFLMGALIYPVAGNWTWGGGWLANLGSNLGLAHGLVDPAGGGLVHLLGASVALAGLLVFLPRRARTSDQGATPLPETTFPLLSLLGVGLIFAGLASWVNANPLLAGAIELQRMLLNTFVAAAGAALLSVGYTWLVAGRPDALMGARGVGGAVAASLAAAAFIPTWAALALGALIGLLTPIAIFVFDRVLRWDDPTAAITVHGLGGALGLVAIGFLADGTAGAGWNGIGGGEYLRVSGQGVTGLLAASGFRPDFPLQLQAQLVGGASLLLFGFFVAWLSLAPLATAVMMLRPRKIATPGAGSGPTPSLTAPRDEVAGPEAVRQAPSEEVEVALELPGQA